MTQREERERDPFRLQQALARLARIKVAGAARKTEEVREQWERDNVIERVLLGRRLAGGSNAPHTWPDRDGDER